MAQTAAELWTALVLPATGLSLSVLTTGLLSSTQNKTLLQNAQALIASRPHDDWTGLNPQAPDMLRWKMYPATPGITHKWEMYVHKYLKSDTGNYHDHPWDSLSILIAGRLSETLPNGTSKTLATNSITYRPASQAHRLGIVGTTPPITLFAVGSWHRTCGYQTPTGWIPWAESPT